MCRRWSRAADVAAGCVAVAAIGVTYWRLHYGIDFTDEAYYVAVPYRLIKGARVFVDTTAVAQGFVAVLVYPIFRAYYAVRGLEGIILFDREMHLLFSLGVGISVFLALKSVLETRRALLAATAVAVFAPFNIHGLSYDTLGSGFFTAGTFLGFRSLQRPSRRRLHVACGFCLGLSIFAYPPLIAAVLASTVIRFFLVRKSRWRAGAVYELTSLTLPVAGMLALVLVAGPGSIVRDYDARTALTRQPHTVLEGAFFVVRELGRAPLLVVAVSIVLVLWRRSPLISVGLLLVLPFLAIAQPISIRSSLEYVARYGALAVPLFVLVRGRQGASALMFAVWLPALVAGLITAYVSSNGGTAFGIGFLPAAVVTTVFLTLAVERASSSVPRAALPAAIAVCLLVALELGPSYRDASLRHLTAPVRGGPYAGLTTTGPKRAFLTHLSRDLAGVTSSCRVLFFNSFPAGYLLTPGEPDTNTTWMTRSEMLPSMRRALRAYYRSHGVPDLILELRLVPYNVLDPASAPDAAARETYPRGGSVLDTVGRSRYVTVIRRRDYTVYEKKQRRAASTDCVRRGASQPSGDRQLVVATTPSPQRSRTIRKAQAPVGAHEPVQLGSADE
jgi:hypothetical protein